MRFLLIGFLLLAPAAYPQTPTATASSSPAVALASQALAALTGSVTVSDVTLTGTGTRQLRFPVVANVRLRRLWEPEQERDTIISAHLLLPNEPHDPDR